MDNAEPLASLGYDPLLRLFWKVFMAGVLVSLVWSVGVASWTPVNYLSTARIEVKPNSFPTDYWGLVTQAKIIESYSVLTNVIASLDLEHQFAQQAGQVQWSMDETYLKLIGNLSVRQLQPAGLIEISVTNLDSKLGAAIANGIANSYLAFCAEKWESERQSGKSFLKYFQASLQKGEADRQHMENNLKNFPVRSPSYQKLKVKIEEVRQDDAYFDRTLKSQITEMNSPPGLPVVRDVARPAIKPIESKTMDFSISFFWGVLGTATIGGGVVWIAVFARRFRRRQHLSGYISRPSPL
jgi:uncharacterized protein involved in exopolysaccharide biosynthesis